jgi:hypothetical protein
MLGSFYTYIYVCVWIYVLKKVINLEYNKTKECEILIFGDDFKNLYLFKNEKQKHVMHWEKN